MLNKSQQYKDPEDIRWPLIIVSGRLLSRWLAASKVPRFPNFLPHFSSICWKLRYQIPSPPLPQIITYRGMDKTELPNSSERLLVSHWLMHDEHRVHLPTQLTTIFVNKVGILAGGFTRRFNYTSRLSTSNGWCSLSSKQLWFWGDWRIWSHDSWI